MKKKFLIIGSGIGGLGAASWMKYYGKDFMVVDGCSELPKNLHNGVHYLHSIPELPFEASIKSIVLTDGVLEHGDIHSSPKLMHSLKYSAKVREVQHPSSIMDIGKTKEVFMPKTNSINDLIEQMYTYSKECNFEFGWWIKDIDIKDKMVSFENKSGESLIVYYENLISTIPLNILNNFVKSEFISSLELKSSPVYITNFKVVDIVPNWLINLYVPERYSPIYRASILNGICSVESMKELDKTDIKNTIDMFFMFSLVPDSVERYTWNTGKVISINRDDRLRVIEELSKMSIYCAGRFSLWNRKLLIDSTINQSKAIVEYLIGGDWNKCKEKLIQ